MDKNDEFLEKMVKNFIEEMKRGKKMRKFEKVSRMEGKEIELPTRSTGKSAGYDFICPEDTICKSHEITMVKTGVKAKFPEDEGLFLFNRSSNPKKKGLIILNGVGVVDADYYGNEDNDGEIAGLFYNMLEEDVEIKAGDKIMQGVFIKYLKVEDDDATGERKGGFGSTGR